LRKSFRKILTAGSLFLNRRAEIIPIRTKHTAVSFLGLQHFSAIRTFPEKLAGILRHLFGGFLTTMGTGNGRL
jgi:hypothetical protein